MPVDNRLSPSAPPSLDHLQLPFKRIHLELTNVCEFDCAFCPKCLMERPYGYMDSELARRLMAEIKAENLAQKVTLHVMGEPTLHPDFFPLLSYAADLELPLGLTTNGASLGGPVGQRLLDTPLHQIDVSLQTPDAESFAMRGAKGLSFEQYAKGAVEFFAQYHERHPETIFKFRFLNTRFPPKSIDAFRGEQLRVMSTTAQLRETFAHWVELVYRTVGDEAPDLDTALERVNKLVSHKWNVVEVLPNVFFETYVLSDWGNAFKSKHDKVRPAWAGYCDGMRDHCAVLYNGDVTLCCVDFNGQTVFDNVQDKSLSQVLAGDGLKEIMAAFKKYKLVHPYCRQCLGGASLTTWLIKPVVSIVAMDLLRPYFYKQTRIF